jgi:ribosomal protein L11 methyltransferase
MQNYVSALKPNGSLFLSGFFLEDFEIIKQSASSFGIINIQHHTHDNWVTAQFLKQ